MSVIESTQCHCIITCAGEEVVAIFVERNGHDSVCEIECLLYSISMVNINVQVHHTWMVSAAATSPALHIVSHLDFV